MTKLKFLAVAVIAMAMLVVPGAAMAHHHSGHKAKHAKRHHKRHGRVHHGATVKSQSPSETQSSNGSVEVRNSSVVSFDSTSGKLTITLPGSQTLTGNVTNSTQIECEAADQQGKDENGQGNDRRMFRDGSGDSSGDNQAQEQDQNEQSDQNDQNDQNDNDADEQGAPQGQQCSSADLTPNAQISKAELDGNGDFTKVELVK